jgi:hypothetical protein
VALPDGRFVYTDGEVAGDPDPSLLTANVLARVDELARSRAARADPLSLSAVPRIVDAEPRPNVEASRLSLDRAALRVLLAVDGRRSVGDLLSIGRPVEVIEHLRALADAGVITLDAPSGPGRRPGAPDAVSAPPQTPEPAVEPPMNVASRPSAPPPGASQPASQPERSRTPAPPPAQSVEPTNGTVAPGEAPPDLAGGAPPGQNGASGEPYDGSRAPAADTPASAPAEAHRPITPAPGASQQARTPDRAQPGPPMQRIGPRPPNACPKLGFGDDPATAFPRATRLHRCFAFGRPQLLSTEQQELLCLTPDHVTCPRLQGYGAPPGQGRTRSAGLSAAVAAGAVPSPTFDDTLTPGPTAGRSSARRLMTARDEEPGELEYDWRRLWDQYRVPALLLVVVLAVVVVGLVVFVSQLDNEGDLSSLPNAATVSALDSGTPPVLRRATPTLAAPPALATPEPDQDATPPA